MQGDGERSTVRLMGDTQVRGVDSQPSIQTLAESASVAASMGKARRTGRNVRKLKASPSQCGAVAEGEKEADAFLHEKSQGPWSRPS